ncbi:MAG: aminotransferase class V-fold PLP-dependent enzyme [Limnohabitans sp.]|nr:aminotransferase class V-fold PLP-dependent enzyme [Limnohabitans sp.]
MTTDTFVIACQRHLFDIPDEVAYFNCAYQSPLLRAAVASGEAGISLKTQPWHLKPADFFSLPEKARSLFAELIHARSDDIAIVGSASYGIETALKNIHLQPADRVVICAEEFPSNLYPVRRAVELAGAELVTVQRPADDDWTAAVLSRISAGTRLAVLTHCHWTDGGLIDLVAVRKALDIHDALLVVDATQSLGAMPLDVSSVRPDFLVAAAYKWLLGPYSLGFLYAAPHLQTGEALEENWVNRAGAQDFTRLLDYSDGYAEGARRYDMGERSNFIALPMAIAALEQILQWQPQRIARTLRLCNDQIANEAAAWGMHAAPADLRAGHFLGLRWPGSLPASLTDKLAAAQVHVSIRGSAIRVTPHLYNNENDVARLLNVLQDTARQTSPAK